MNPVDALWHLLNFFAPALGLGLLAASSSKLLWRRELRATRWSRLCVWASSASALALLAGLVITGHDGRVGTYVAMIVACAAALGWVGFYRR